MVETANESGRVSVSERVRANERERENESERTRVGARTRKGDEEGGSSWNHGSLYTWLGAASGYDRDYLRAPICVAYLFHTTVRVDRRQVEVNVEDDEGSRGRAGGDGRPIMVSPGTKTGSRSFKSSFGRISRLGGGVRPPNQNKVWKWATDHPRTLDGPAHWLGSSACRFMFLFYV